MPLISSHVHGQFCWAELVAHDMRSAIQFYCDVLNWRTTDLNASCDDSMPHVQFEHSELPVAGLIQMIEPLRQAELPSVWNTYVCVDDLSQALEKAVKLGATVTCPMTSAGEHGLVAFLRGPTGAVIGLWQRGSHGGAAVRGDINSVCWNELACRDVVAALEFYGAMFNWEFEENKLSPTPYFVIRTSDGMHVGGILQMTEEWGDMPSHWTVFFHVDAVDAVTARVQQLNGSMLVSPFDTPVGRIAVLADNQGAAFGVVRFEQVPVPEDAISV